MATFGFDGIDEMMAQMDTDLAGLEERINRGLTAGAQILTQALREEAAATFKAPTGELARKVAPDKRPTHSGTEYSIEVYARGEYVGKRGSPRRAETVGFVQEYGRRGQAANPWNKNAREKSKEEIGAAIEREMFRK